MGAVEMPRRVYWYIDDSLRRD